MTTFVKGEICLFVLHALAIIYLFPFYILTFLVLVVAYIFIISWLPARNWFPFSIFHFSGLGRVTHSFVLFPAAYIPVTYLEIYSWRSLLLLMHIFISPWRPLLLLMY